MAETFIVTAGTRVSLYDNKSDKVVRSYSRFQDNAYSGHFRHDGKLICAGDKTGAVKVFDVASKAMLRQLRTHSGAVQATIFSSDGHHVYSGGDDKSVRCYDVETGDEVFKSTTAHTDYVRSMCHNPSVPQVWVSGSYDHSVKIWDRRQQASVLPPIMHDQPVESLVMARSGTMLYTASGSDVKVWDIIGGGRLLHSFSNHQKNITDLCLDETGSRLLSCGLDGLVKIYSLGALKMTHGMKAGQPLVSMALSRDSSKLALGCVDGSLVVRTRTATGPRPASMVESEGGRVDISAQQGENKIFYKGAGSAVARSDDRMLETEKRNRLQPYETYLKEFKYHKALDTALHTHNPTIVVTVLEELSHRSGLSPALQGRDERTLEPLLSFATRYVAHPRYATLVLAVVHRLVDLYAGVLGHTDSIDELFLKMHRQVKAEMSMQRRMMSVQSALDGIISVNYLSQANVLGKRHRETDADLSDDDPALVSPDILDDKST